MPKYRPNVALILRNTSGALLFCERSDWPGTWQFPQGGLVPGESPLDALWREAREEIALLPFQYCIAESRGPYRYLFQGKRKKDGCEGQEQTYFLADLLAPEFKINFGSDPEFRDAVWLPPDKLRIDLVPSLKQGVYRRVLADFFGIL